MTNHAREKAISRGVEEVDIERIINAPSETIYDEYEETYKSYGRATDPYTKEPYYLIIVHSAFNTYVKVITVMWVNNNKGLKSHGFSNL
jgi:ABC-type transport system substrate-binding protein